MLEKIEENINKKFEVIFKDASDCSAYHGIDICLPKNRGRPRLDGINQQPEEFYRIFFFLIFVEISNLLKLNIKLRAVFDASAKTTFGFLRS